MRNVDYLLLTSLSMFVFWSLSDTEIKQSKKTEPIFYIVRDVDLGVGECELVREDGAWITGKCLFSGRPNEEVKYSCPRYRTFRKKSKNENSRTKTQ